MIRILFILLFSVITFIIPDQVNAQKKINSKKTEKSIILKPARLITRQAAGVSIKGEPQITKCEYGKAVTFNGSDQAIFLESVPVNTLTQFTVEVIFCPASGGNFEQRFFHWGEITGGRLLLELRATKTDWYFDAFIKTATQQKTLIDPKLLHPLDQCYHLAFVIDDGMLKTFVNGIKELEGQINPEPFSGGKISLGVRQNEVSWFKGTIYKIRITKKALKPEEFLTF